MTITTLFDSETIVLDSSAPAKKPCRFCGHGEGTLTGPKPPHANGVRCAQCKRHLGWLPSENTDDDFQVVE